MVKGKKTMFIAGESWQYCKFLTLQNLSKACSFKKIEEIKKIIYSTFFVLATSFGFSQNNGQNNETVNHGRVIGSFDLGTQEVITLIDEETGCVRKSSPHSKGLFNPNEAVEIVLKGNKQMAEIRKPSLSEKVFADKNCNEEQEDCLSDLCVIKNDENKPNSVINSWTQSLVITLNLCHEFTSKKMEAKREGRNSSLYAGAWSIESFTRVQCVNSDYL